MAPDASMFTWTPSTSISAGSRGGANTTLDDPPWYLGVLNRRAAPMPL
jgi:hypothetical protein